MTGRQGAGQSGRQHMRDEKVLVIGGLGFIGVNLTQQLVERGARVAVLTPDRAKHAGEAAAFERNGVEIIEGDLRDQPLIEKHVAGRQLVINLSGQSGAVRSMEDPWTDLDVNLRGNLVLLEALRARNRDAKVVFAGSRLQYGHVDQLPVEENAPQAALCLHAVHKQTVEQYLDLYRRLFGIRYSVARITNPYGPGQPTSRTGYGVINRMIHLAIADRALTIYGDGNQLRDYIHVDDVVVALVAMAEAPAADGRVYNVGSGTGTKMVDLAQQVIRIAGGGRIEHVAWPPLAEQVETGDFMADISRIMRELEWTPSIALRDGLEQTVAFYRRIGAA
ncbi:MAG TPA: NAD-dependent epimerase/dehydratase family protein [Vicinamibacterales bacterium]|nr:NAD-dependent epimerase/dehydratase family protein [Vicinamibacterales bacterium]